MRKITQAAQAAFLAGRAFGQSNTAVTTQDGESLLSLFGNIIARRSPEGYISITNCGFGTVTTRERLHGLPGVHLCQRKGEQILNGEVWDGDWTEVSI